MEVVALVACLEVSPSLREACLVASPSPLAACLVASAACLVASPSLLAACLEVMATSQALVTEREETDPIRAAADTTATKGIVGVPVSLGLPSFVLYL